LSSSDDNTNPPNITGLVILGEFCKSITDRLPVAGLFLGASQEARDFGLANRAGTLNHPPAVGGFFDHTTLDHSFHTALDAISFKIHDISPFVQANRLPLSSDERFHQRLITNSASIFPL
jgi:hypothetical protein